MLSRKSETAPVAKAKSVSSAFRQGDPTNVLEHNAERAPDGVRPAWSISKLGIDPPIQRKCACGGSGKCEKCKTKDQDGDVPKRVQAKLTINQPGDRYEQEADHVAQQVMRMTEASPITRQAPSPDAPRVQRKHVDTSGLGQAEATPTVHEVLRSPGAPLDAGTRAFMEPRFGQDFSRVRVHSGALAEQSARDINARAYTAGHDIVFGAGELSPASCGGRGLLAHELAHVIQQTSRSVPAIQRKAKSDQAPDDKKPTLVKIVAFAGSTDAAVAYVADGSATTLRPEPLALSRNSLEKGEYTYIHNKKLLRAENPKKGGEHTSEHDKGRDDAEVKDPKDKQPPSLYWRTPFVEGTKDPAYAESVKIVILPRYIEDFLTEHGDSKSSGKTEDVVEVLEAAQILAKKGVTEDQLALEKHRRTDAEEIGFYLPKTDLVSWTRAFVEEQQAGEKKALGTRASLDEAKRRLDKIPPEYARYLVTYLTVDEDLANQGIMYGDIMEDGGVLGRMGFTSHRELWTTVDQFSKAFDSELRSLAAAVLNAAEAVGLEAYDRYIGTQNSVLNPAVLQNQLTEAKKKDPGIASQMKTIRDEQANAPGYKQRVSDELSKTTELVTGLVKNVPKTETERYDERLSSQKEELNKSLAANSRVKIGKVRNLDAFDLLSAGPHDAQVMLGQALAGARRQIRRARKELSDDDRFVYGADKIINAKKEELHIRSGGTVDQVVDGIVKAELSKETPWETIWGVIDFIVNLLPIETPVGLFLRTIAAGINAGMATDKYATESLLNAVDFSESAPSASGLGAMFLITAGGVVFDAHATGILSAEGSGLTLALKDERSLSRGSVSADTGEAGRSSGTNERTNSASGERGADQPKPAGTGLPTGPPELPADQIGPIEGSVPGERHAQFGKDHEIWEVEDRETHFISCELHSPEPFEEVKCPEGMGAAANQERKELIGAEAEKRRKAEQDAAGESRNVGRVRGSGRVKDRRYRLKGAPGKLAESRSGYQVYFYYDDEGTLLYVGKSGGGGSSKKLRSPAEIGKAEARANTWIDRLKDDHIETEWIGEATLVTVVYDLDEPGAYALEESWIPEAKYNKQEGGHSVLFPESNTSDSALQVSKRAKQARFRIEVLF